MTISKDVFPPDRIHLEQVQNWYQYALHLYGTGRSALDPVKWIH